MKPGDTSFLIIGARGMLGTDLTNRLGSVSGIVHALDIDEIDITDSEMVDEIIGKIRPDIVINTAALTDVDGCESRVDEAFAVNALGPDHIAHACARVGSLMIHISTDYVFDGSADRPYKENDPIGPAGVYAVSKTQGEENVRKFLPENHLIVRTQWLYGLHGKNFVETILRISKDRKTLRVVNDQSGSPTFSDDLAQALVKLAEIRAKGTLHVTNSGETTWFGFAEKILEFENIGDVTVEPMTSSELDRPAPRPLYSVLDNSRFLDITGYKLRDWESALMEYLSMRKK